MGKIGEFISKHKVPILIVVGLVGVYVLYELLSSSSSSNSQNAAIDAAQEAAAQQEADLQAAYAAQSSGASAPTTTTSSSLTPTIAAVTAQPTTSASGATSCPPGYQLDPTGTQCILSSSPAPIATAPTGVVTQPATQPYAPAANSPLAAAAAASGGVNPNAGATGGATGVVGNIVSQWSAIFSPTNPFEINNPSMGANAAATINNATSEFCSNDPSDPSCSAANLALASAQATTDQTLATTPYSADNSTESSINNPAPTSNGSGTNVPYATPITGGQRIANFLAGGGNSTPISNTAIPPTGTTTPQPVTIATPTGVASSRGLSTSLSALVPNDLLASIGPHTSDITGESF